MTDRNHDAAELDEPNLSRWQPYPEYRDSGVEWLGEIPAHWTVKRLDFIAIVKARLGWKGLKASEYVDDGYIFLSTPNIKGEIIDYENVNYITPERYYESPEIMLENGDVLLAKDGSTLGIASVVRDLPAPATVNSSIAVIRIQSDLHSIYLYRYLMANYIQSIIQLFKDGMGVPHLFQKDIKKFQIILPPLSEQHAIAAFLDRKTAEIDALIAKKRELIALLHEQRSAIISHAVTKGLNPDAPMKDSGIEWLGEIPAGWEIASVYARFDVQLGKMLNQNAVRNVSPAAYLRNINVQWDWVNLSDLLEMDFSLEEREKYSLRSGDLLVCEGGDVGRTAMWRGEMEECYFQKAILRVRPNKSSKDEPRFFYYIMRNAAKLGVFEAEGNRSTIFHLTAEKLNQHRFAFPPISEQRTIVALLDYETAQIDLLISKTEGTISRLQEYRSALISAAVTGKIDVRAEAGVR